MFMVGLQVDCKDYYVIFITKNKLRLPLHTKFKVKSYYMVSSAMSAKPKNN